MKQQKIFLVDEILDYLEARPNQIVSYKELYESIWEVPAYGGYKKTIFNTICRARELLDDGYAIYTIHDVGYMYVKEKK